MIVEICFNIIAQNYVELEFHVLDDSILTTPGKYLKFFWVKPPTHTETHDESEKENLGSLLYLLSDFFGVAFDKHSRS